MDSFTGPNSTSCLQMPAINRPSDVPPVVESSGVMPVAASIASLMSAEKWPGGVRKASPLIFASSVIAMPLLLDRRVTVMQAVLASWQAVLTNPVPLALWAALIMVLTAVGMATAMLGLIVILPVLGHASWHAYRDLLDTTRLPERLPPEVAP